MKPDISLLQNDRSRHQWFLVQLCYDSVVILVDASSEIFYAQLVEVESTSTVMVRL